MKRLRFQELLLLAESERTARAVSFDHPVTVVRGQNDRGKSCLIKSLYMALGATPKTVHPKWAALEPTLHLFFSIDDTKYSILKIGTRYALFDSNHVLIGNYTSVTKGLGPRFAELFDFRLELTNASNRKSEQATPALLFLPFYFDQDSSWTENWNAFESLKQFANYRKAIAEFHTGIKPNAYYQAKADKTKAEDLRDSLRHDRNVVKRVLDRIETLLQSFQFDIDLSAYSAEIEILLEKCNELRLDEEKLKEEMLQVDCRRRLVERQIHVFSAA